MTSETILVVDDNRQIADYLAGTILPGMGYRSLVAYDGKSAWRLIKEVKPEPDLILLDLQLPDTTGMDFLRELDRDGYNIPTILITAHGSEQVAVDAFRLGVQDYLGKPIDIDNLQNAIDRALMVTTLRREKSRLTAQLQERVSWLTALSQVGRSVTSTLELDDVLRRIVDAGVQLTGAEEGFLALMDKDSGQLYLRAAKNVDENRIKTMRLLVTDTLVGHVLRSQRPARAIQPTQGAPLKVSTGYLVYSLLHVPILSKGVALGVLSVDNRNRRQAFKDRDEVLLSSLADYAAVALENAALYQKARQEIAERRRVEKALRESDERYALAVRGANDGIWDWDIFANRVYYSERWATMLGYDVGEIGNSMDEWLLRVHPEDIEQLRTNLDAHLNQLSSHFESEYRILDKNGAYRWMLCRGIAVAGQGGTVYRMAGSQTDITARKQAENKLLRDALYDSLTGLPNRALFIDRLKHALVHAQRNGRYMYAVLFLDLDRFKDVNDSLGHSTGDQLLISVARLLENTLRPLDTVARLGGDEFVILLEDISQINDVVVVADRIQSNLRSATLLEGHTLFVTASIGIILSMTGYVEPEDVLRDADIAMYRAKANGRARYEIFDDAMRQRIMERMNLEKELRQAVSEKSLQVFYQPIMATGSGELVGFEALVRWHHPERGLILPTEFIQLAEETGLVIQIDRIVLEEACRRMAEWQRNIPCDPHLTLNVNISGKQVGEKDFVQELKRIFNETGLNPDCLHLGITENAIMENFDSTADILQMLRELGVQVHIDDFGIGYSSLSYLSRFPINALKIDHTFVGMMMQDSTHMKIVQAIVRLTHGLGMKVIAEGVETETQLAQLRELACEYVQGNLISMPLEPDAAADFISSQPGWQSNT
ncbi:MAG: EAL domain-containing protein [Anaerolineales bacterium]|nr:EAL domain-containing protein [Anaerolineales bacterium]